MMASANETSTPAWVCPIDHSPLTNQASGLVCPQGHSFPICRGIPRFVASESYTDHFGLQWRQYRRTQLDSYTGIPISRDRLRRCLGEDLWERLPGMSVLECGCGAGRFTEVLLGRGAVLACVDLSSAVETNADLFPIGPEHRVAQADITKLPFEGGQFDLVLCLGVIQHTPVPENTIAKLYQQVRRGGWLVIDHYTHEPGRWTSVKPVYRAVMKRLRPETALRCTEELVNIFLPLHRRLRTSRLGWLLLCRISPITTFYRSVPSLPERLQREWALLDTHDSLTDYYKHLRATEDIARALRALGASEIVCEYAGNGVEARCQHP
jgi:SAM-dependent methyltransferase